jgi:hypothetical protein
MTVFDRINLPHDKLTVYDRSASRPKIRLRILACVSLNNAYSNGALEAPAQLPPSMLSLSSRYDDHAFASCTEVLPTLS